jgi:hypothetical protein
MLALPPVRHLAARCTASDEDETMQVRRPRPDPRVVASLAIIAALIAIALEIVYAVGTFAMATVEQIPVP